MSGAAGPPLPPRRGRAAPPPPPPALPPRPSPRTSSKGPLEPCCPRASLAQPPPGPGPAPARLHPSPPLTKQPGLSGTGRAAAGLRAGGMAGGRGEPATPADVFPLLVPCDARGGAYAGWLTLPAAGRLAGALWVRLAGLPPPGASFARASIELGPELAALVSVRPQLGWSQDGGALICLSAALHSTLRQANRSGPGSCSNYVRCMLASVRSQGNDALRWRAQDVA